MYRRFIKGGFMSKKDESRKSSFIWFTKANWSNSITYESANATIISKTSIWQYAVICGVGGMISQIGDLAASAIKRNHEIKDYGNLIPGHGGILDRFDSVIFTAPIIYYMAIMFL